MPKCTTEGIGYALECWTCRLQGRTYRYIGESSRSPYQRGQEHWKEILAGKKTHPLVDHFLDFHQGTRQEVLFRTLATFQTALHRQVWESVEIGTQQCLNHKTEWGSSKDPTLIPGRSPINKGLARAQTLKQVAGNTRKRVRQAEPTQEEGTDNSSRPAKVMRPSTLPGTTSSAPTDPGTPARSRWGRWQVHLSSPESPEEPQPRRRREREKLQQKATGPSGLKGPSIQGQSGKIATSQPPQGREGTVVEGSTTIGTPGPRNLPPDLRNNQGNLPWELRPRKKSRKGPICDQMYK